VAQLLSAAGAAYDLKERLYKVYEVETKEEAWGEYLNWEASIPDELAKPFRPVKTAFRNWKDLHPELLRR
jgi:hypothetical protein